MDDLSGALMAMTLKMSRSAICTNLRLMVNELEQMPDEFWVGVYPLIRVTLRRADGDGVVLVVGTEPADGEGGEDT